MTSSFKVFTFAIAGVVLATGCADCKGGQQGRSYGEVRVLSFDTDGNPTQGADGLYDFGIVSMGKTEPKDLVVQNVGTASLTISTFSKTNAGDTATKAGAGVDDPSPIFTLTFDQEVVVPTGETVTIPMAYAPPQIEGVTRVEHQVLLAMKSLNTEAGKETANLTLKGVAVAGECDVPATIDFGAVARGDTFTRTFEFYNSRAIETNGYLGDIDSPQGAGIFTLSPDSPKGEFLIAGETSKIATFTFAPTEALDYRATVRMRRADGCPEQPVVLIGTGVDAVLSWSPPQVDFGYASPGVTATAQVTISNLSLADVTMSPLVINDQGASTPSNIFKLIDTGDGTAGTSIIVPHGTRQPDATITPGTVTVKFSFKPMVLGRKSATFKGTTPLESQPLVGISLTGVGGGPDIDVTPAGTMDLGRIAYFAGATTPSAATRMLTVKNVGTRPSPPDSKGNLKLGTGDATNGYVAPYWEVVAHGDATLAEICVGVVDGAGVCTNTLPETGANGYAPNLGLEAGTSTARLDIPVKITPASLGQKEWEVRIFSNDPDEAVTTVVIKANAVELAPCDITVSPVAVNFGVITPPAHTDLAFAVHNNSTTDDCLMSNLQLGTETGTPSGMQPIFSLPNGAQPEVTLAPGETQQFAVRAWPQGQTPPSPAQVNGKVSFNVAHPDTPLREVNLVATIGTGCLTLAPQNINFGTVKVGCNSPTRTINITNACTSQITLNSTTLGSGAGEFNIVSAPANGTVLSASSSTPVSVQVRYHPAEVGPDSNSVVLTVTQNSATATYVVPLTGEGNTTGFNTDTFRQDSKPKADILLVIDDSCSMSDKQTKLASNMDHFLSYAVENQVDFHIASTNTEIFDPGHGKFCAVSNDPNRCTHGNKILTPSTTNLLNEFRNIVKLGTNGGSETCVEPAMRALSNVSFDGTTPPYINDPAINGGFLRDDAVLAVVCVTDALDQIQDTDEGWPLSTYLNRLVAVKGSQRANMFTYNVIGPFLPSAPSDCSYDDANIGCNGDASQVDCHTQLVTATNGVKEEICLDDWSQSLERVGKNAFGFRTNFYLTTFPDLSVPTNAITVQIDGQNIPAYDVLPDGGQGAQIWTYDAATNSVNFAPLYVPEPGQTLTINYTATCIL